MKHVFIVNPISGQGRAFKMVDNIHKACQEMNLDYEVVFTRKPKDAIEIVKKYKKCENVIYSVGGDGTLNEVVNGIVGTKNKLAIIPGGSGNDFYTTIKDIKETEFKIDIGKVNDRYFINVVSVGIDAEIGDNALLMKKKHIPRKQIYNASIVYTFFKYKFKEIEFKLNDTKMKDYYTIVTIMNGRVYGGGYKIAPNAIVNDGLFDIYFVDKLPKSKIPKLILKLAKGTHEESPHVHKRLADKITFKSDKPIICGVDGETLYEKKYDIKMLKNKVTVYQDKELIKKILEN